jgi:hypothetical protein
MRMLIHSATVSEITALEAANEKCECLFTLVIPDSAARLKEYLGAFGQRVSGQAQISTFNISAEHGPSEDRQCNEDVLPRLHGAVRGFHQNRVAGFHRRMRKSLPPPAVEFVPANRDSRSLGPDVIEDECGDEEPKKDSNNTIADVIEIGIRGLQWD